MMAFLGVGEFPVAVLPDLVPAEIFTTQEYTCTCIGIYCVACVCGVIAILQFALYTNHEILINNEVQ